MPYWDVVDLESVLVRAGYTIQVDGALDPVTKSAAADFLTPADWRQLESPVAKALLATVITGRRDPAAWNQRFGTNRATRMVERPLAGENGHLDGNGNIRNGG